MLDWSGSTPLKTQHWEEIWVSCQRAHRTVWEKSVPGREKSKALRREHVWCGQPRAKGLGGQDSKQGEVEGQRSRGWGQVKLGHVDGGKNKVKQGS